MRAVTYLFVACLTLTPAGALAAGDARSDAKAQVDFGIAVAQKGLWKEARYRWERATEIDPTYAAAFNNLAIACEQSGDFESARKAYEGGRARTEQSADRKQNYDLFKKSMTANRAPDRQ
jgi:Tfp pilus assembly protein PilF